MTPTWKANPVRSWMVVPIELAGLNPSAKLDTDHVRAPSTRGRASRRAWVVVTVGPAAGPR